VQAPPSMPSSTSSRHPIPPAVWFGWPQDSAGASARVLPAHRPRTRMHPCNPHAGEDDAAGAAAFSPSPRAGTAAHPSPEAQPARAPSARAAGVGNNCTICLAAPIERGFLVGQWQQEVTCRGGEEGTRRPQGQLDIRLHTLLPFLPPSPQHGGSSHFCACAACSTLVPVGSPCPVSLRVCMQACWSHSPHRDGPAISVGGTAAAPHRGAQEKGLRCCALPASLGVRRCAGSQWSAS